MSAKVKIVSKGKFISRGMPFDIYCDGKIIGTMNKYITITFDDAGIYTLQAKAKYWETSTIVVKVDEGKVLNLQIRSKNKFFEKLYALMLVMPVLACVNIFIHVEWLQITTIIISGLFVLSISFYLFFKRKNVWVLQDDN